MKISKVVKTFLETNKLPSQQLDERDARRGQTHLGRGILDDVKKAVSSIKDLHNRFEGDRELREKALKRNGKGVERVGAGVWDDIKDYAVPALGVLGTLGTAAHLYSEVKSAKNNQLVGQKVDAAHERARKKWGYGKRGAGIWDDMVQKVKKYSLPALGAVATLAPLAVAAYSHSKQPKKLSLKEMNDASENIVSSLARQNTIANRRKGFIN